MRFPILPAIIAIAIVLSAILSTHHRIVAVVPYCFDGVFGSPGSFMPCSELKRYYEV